MKTNYSSQPAFVDTDLNACKATLNHGSRSFLAASRLLPVEMRDAATVLYAFCREADDLIDLGDDPDAALCNITSRIDALYAGEPKAFAADRALSTLVQDYALPRELLDGLVEGFAWDASDRKYATLDQVHAYASRVAGTVGAMMALLMGAREPHVVARACDLGVAMQLTNICRDVGEDAQAGRCYLPSDWLLEEGVDVNQWLANPQPLPGVRRVVSRLLNQADLLYARADSGISALPRSCQRGIRAARVLYAGIGDIVVERNYDSVSSRAFVPASRKAALLGRALLMPAPDNKHLLGLEPLPETLLWVRVIENTAPQIESRATALSKPVASSLGQEVESVLSIIEQLERHRRFDLQSNGKIPAVHTMAVRA
jgi:phytoene synthase